MQRLLPPGVDLLTLFPADFAAARRCFREAAEALGWQLESHPIAQTGPMGEELALDVAVSDGPREAPVLVVSSGIHGVEGFFGSAVQLGALRALRTRPPLGACARVIMLHALNPYGFAWRRRVNEDNVDLNRNFLLAGETYAGSPEGYAELDALLNPRRPPSRWEPIGIKFAYEIARSGLAAVQQSIAAGQYDAPRGLFFGGAAPSALHGILSRHVSSWLDAAASVVHLDLHTGLGSWATHQLLIDHRLSAAQEAWLRTVMGADRYVPVDAAGIDYVARGGLSRWCHERWPERSYLYATAEFGTYAAPKVLAALRAENQSHHWGHPDASDTARAKRALMEAFCPRSPRWRRRVVADGIDLVLRAAAGLAGQPLSATRR